LQSIKVKEYVAPNWKILSYKHYIGAYTMSDKEISELKEDIEELKIAISEIKKNLDEEASFTIDWNQEVFNDKYFNQVSLSLPGTTSQACLRFLVY